MIITTQTRINGIGLRGKRRSGKDTTCRMLTELSSVFERVAFADALKLDLLEAFDQSRGWLERNKSLPIVRCSMQAWGQRAKELYGPNYWIKRAESRIKELTTLGKIPVLTDVRFPQELDFCKSAGFIVIQILGPFDKDTSPEAKDISEVAIDNLPSDFVIDNSRHQPRDLRDALNEILKQLYLSEDFRTRLHNQH